MSELKDWTASEIEEYDDARLELAEDGKIDCTRVYIKKDVDKVIADLEESHKKEVKQLLILNREQANAANRLRDSMEQAIRHQKYKRCLAMAYVEWLKQIIIGLHPESILYRKAFKREHKWKELAEKFKEAK